MFARLSGCGAFGRRVKVPSEFPRQRDRHVPGPCCVELSGKSYAGGWESLKGCRSKTKSFRFPRVVTASKEMMTGFSTVTVDGMVIGWSGWLISGQSGVHG
jgi:hypothetical protein